ncbi:MAG: hypothetical protein K1X88_07365 [Nannocystaceae bacterium]|nr:hypothetical protein [Nannocystaceae bacterium]
MAALVLGACTRRPAGATREPTTARSDPAAAQPADAADPTALLAEGEAAHDDGRHAEAVALIGRALADGGLATDDERRALVVLAASQEAMRDCTAVLRTYELYLARFPEAPDRAVTDARRGACQAELGQWQASADSFAAVADAPGQLPSTRIEALARQGFALFNLDRFDDAERVLARADALFEQAEREQSERFASYYFVGMARFYRGAIHHRRFREVAIELPENVMKQRFEQKLALLREAQDAYNHTIRAKHMFWVSAAGYQLGALFSEFYDALMHAPVPTWLDAKQRRIYYDELKKQIRPVVDKAIWVLEKNLETARRLGFESEFTAQTEARLSHLQATLASDAPELGRPLPRLAELDAAAATSPEPDATAGTDAPQDAPSPADRKLFVPQPTPLAP